jgi:hypothetical protein
LTGRASRKGKGAAGRVGDSGGAGRGESEEGEEERKVKGGAADQWGRDVSETGRKEKEMAAVGCRGEVVGGLLGRWAER